MATVNNVPGSQQGSLIQSLGIPARQPAPAERPEVSVPDLGKGARQVEAAVAPTREAVHEAAKRIEEFVQSVGRTLSFSVDSSTGRSILRVVDPQSGEVVRQLPPEEVLRVARAVEFMQGVLVNHRA